MTLARWFHGTDQEAARSILCQGFREPCFFATHKVHARSFGPVVFEIEADHPHVPTKYQADGIWGETQELTNITPAHIVGIEGLDNNAEL